MALPVEPSGSPGARHISLSAGQWPSAADSPDHTTMYFTGPKTEPKLFLFLSEKKVRPQKSPRHDDPSPYDSADLDSISRPPSAPFEVSSWQRWQRIASLGRLLYWDDQDHLPMGISYGTSVRCTNFPEICAVLNLHVVYTTDGCSFLESLRSSHNDIWMCIYLPTDPPIHAYHIQVLFIYIYIIHNFNQFYL
jgi:hypothetical protein